MKIEAIKNITSNPKIRLFAVSNVFKGGEHIGTCKVVFGEYNEKEVPRQWFNRQVFYVDEEQAEGFKKMYWKPQK